MIENLFNTKKKATTGLILVTLIWGLTFIWMDWAISVAQKAEPDLSHQTLASAFVFFRFFFAAIILLPFIPDLKSVFTDKKIRNGGMWLGLLVWAGFFFQMIGIAYPEITPAVSAFLTSLYVIFTALIGLVLGRQKLTFVMGLGVLLATFGAGWISGPPQLNFNLPEWLTVIGAFMFAAHIIATDRLTRDRNTIHLTVVMLCTVALISFLIIPFFIKSSDYSKIFNLLLLPGFFIPLFCCSIFGSLVALLLLTMLQKELSPVRAAILYALEPVWATFFSLILSREGAVSSWLFIGGSALIIGNLIVEITNLMFNKTSGFKPEIERRFLLDKLPFEIQNKSHIEQIYLPLDKIIINKKGIYFDENILVKNNHKFFSELISLFSNNQNNFSCRIRKIETNNNFKYILTFKIRDSPGIRRELEWELTKSFETLFSLTIPKISKIRYEYSDSAGNWEIDEFLDNNLGLFIAEIELDSLDKEINLPKWIGKEITGDINYLNSTLANN